MNITGSLGGSAPFSSADVDSLSQKPPLSSIPEAHTKYSNSAFARDQSSNTGVEYSSSNVYRPKPSSQSPPMPSPSMLPPLPGHTPTLAPAPSLSGPRQAPPLAPHIAAPSPNTNILLSFPFVRRKLVMEMLAEASRHRQFGDYDVALQLYHTIHDMNQYPHSSYLIGSCLLAKGDISCAITWLYAQFDVYTETMLYPPLSSPQFAQLPLVERMPVLMTLFELCIATGIKLASAASTSSSTTSSTTSSSFVSVPILSRPNTSAHTNAHPFSHVNTTSPNTHIPAPTKIPENSPNSIIPDLARAIPSSFSSFSYTCSSSSSSDTTSQPVFQQPLLLSLAACFGLAMRSPSDIIVDPSLSSASSFNSTHNANAAYRRTNAHIGANADAQTSRSTSTWTPQSGNSAKQSGISLDPSYSRNFLPSLPSPLLHTTTESENVSTHNNTQGYKSIAGSAITGTGTHMGVDLGASRYATTSRPNTPSVRPSSASLSLPSLSLSSSHVPASLLSTPYTSLSPSTVLDATRALAKHYLSLNLPSLALSASLHVLSTAATTLAVHADTLAELSPTDTLPLSRAAFALVAAAPGSTPVLVADLLSTSHLAHTLGHYSIAIATAMAATQMASGPRVPPLQTNTATHSSMDAAADAMDDTVTENSSPSGKRSRSRSSGKKLGNKSGTHISAVHLPGGGNWGLSLARNGGDGQDDGHGDDLSRVPSPMSRAPHSHNAAVHSEDTVARAHAIMTTCLDTVSQYPHTESHTPQYSYHQHYQHQPQDCLDPVVALVTTVSGTPWGRPMDASTNDNTDGNNNNNEASTGPSVHSRGGDVVSAGSDNDEEPEQTQEAMRKTTHGEEKEPKTPPRNSRIFGSSQNPQNSGWGLDACRVQIARILLSIHISATATCASPFSSLTFSTDGHHAGLGAGLGGWFGNNQIFSPSSHRGAVPSRTLSPPPGINAGTGTSMGISMDSSVSPLLSPFLRPASPISSPSPLSRMSAAKSPYEPPSPPSPSAVPATSTSSPTSTSTPPSGSVDLAHPPTLISMLSYVLAPLLTPRRPAFPSNTSSNTNAPSSPSLVAAAHLTFADALTFAGDLPSALMHIDKAFTTFAPTASPLTLVQHATALHTVFSVRDRQLCDAYDALYRALHDMNALPTPPTSQPSSLQSASSSNLTALTAHTNTHIPPLALLAHAAAVALPATSHTAALPVPQVPLEQLHSLISTLARALGAVDVSVQPVVDPAEIVVSNGGGGGTGTSGGSNNNKSKHGKDNSRHGSGTSTSTTVRSAASTFIFDSTPSLASSIWACHPHNTLLPFISRLPSLALAQPQYKHYLSRHPASHPSLFLSPASPIPSSLHAMHPATAAPAAAAVLSSLPFLPSLYLDGSRDFFPANTDTPLLLLAKAFYTELLLRHGPTARVHWYRASIHRCLGDLQAYAADLQSVQRLCPSPSPSFSSALTSSSSSFSVVLLSRRNPLDWVDPITATSLQWPLLSSLVPLLETHYTSPIVLSTTPLPPAPSTVETHVHPLALLPAASLPPVMHLSLTNERMLLFYTLSLHPWAITHADDVWTLLWGAVDAVRVAAGMPGYTESRHSDVCRWDIHEEEGNALALGLHTSRHARSSSQVQARTHTQRKTQRQGQGEEPAGERGSPSLATHTSTSANADINTTTNNSHTAVTSTVTPAVTGYFRYGFRNVRGGADEAVEWEDEYEEDTYLSVTKAEGGGRSGEKQLRGRVRGRGRARDTPADGEAGQGEAGSRGGATSNDNNASDINGKSGRADGNHSTGNDNNTSTSTGMGPVVSSTSLSPRLRLPLVTADAHTHLCMFVSRVLWMYTRCMSTHSYTHTNKQTHAQAHTRFPNNGYNSENPGALGNPEGFFPDSPSIPSHAPSFSSSSPFSSPSGSTSLPLDHLSWLTTLSLLHLSGGRHRATITSCIRALACVAYQRVAHGWGTRNADKWIEFSGPVIARNRFFPESLLSEAKLGYAALPPSSDTWSSLLPYSTSDLCFLLHAHTLQDPISTLAVLLTRCLSVVAPTGAYTQPPATQLHAYHAMQATLTSGMSGSSSSPLHTLPSSAPQHDDRIFALPRTLRAWRLRAHAANILTILARVQYRTAQTHASLLLLHRALSIDPANALAHAALAQHHLLRSSPLLAAQQLSLAHRTSPWHALSLPLHSLAYPSYPLSLASGHTPHLLLSPLLAPALPSIATLVPKALSSALDPYLASTHAIYHRDRHVSAFAALLEPYVAMHEGKMSVTVRIHMVGTHPAASPLMSSSFSASFGSISTPASAFASASASFSSSLTPLSTTLRLPTSLHATSGFIPFPEEISEADSESSPLSPLLPHLPLSQALRLLLAVFSFSPHPIQHLQSRMPHTALTALRAMPWRYMAEYGITDADMVRSAVNAGLLRTGNSNNSHTHLQPQPHPHPYMQTYMQTQTQTPLLTPSPASSFSLPSTSTSTSPSPMPLPHSSLPTSSSLPRPLADSLPLPLSLPFARSPALFDWSYAHSDPATTLVDSPAFLGPDAHDSLPLLSGSSHVNATRAEMVWRAHCMGLRHGLGLLHASGMGTGGVVEQQYVHTRHVVETQALRGVMAQVQMCVGNMCLGVLCCDGYDYMYPRTQTQTQTSGIPTPDFPHRGFSESSPVRDICDAVYPDMCVDDDDTHQPQGRNGRRGDRVSMYGEDSFGTDRRHNTHGAVHPRSASSTLSSRGSAHFTSTPNRRSILGQGSSDALLFPLGSSQWLAAADHRRSMGDDVGVLMALVLSHTTAGACGTQASMLAEALAVSEQALWSHQFTAPAILSDPRTQSRVAVAAGLPLRVRRVVQDSTVLSTVLEPVYLNIFPRALTHAIKHCLFLTPPRIDDALHLAHALYALTGSSEALLLAAQSYLKLGNVMLAKELLVQCIEAVHKDRERLLPSIARIRTATDMQLLVMLHERLETSHLLLASIHYRTGAFAQALSHTLALARAHQHYTPTTTSSSTSTGTGMGGGAAGMAAKTFSRHYIASLRLRIAILCQQRDFPAAGTTVRKYLDLVGPDMAMSVKLVYIYMHQGLADTATDMVMSLLRHAPRSPTLLFTLAACNYTKCAWSAALDAACACVSVDSMHLEARYLLAQCLGKLGCLAPAIHAHHTLIHAPTIDYKAIPGVLAQTVTWWMQWWLAAAVAAGSMLHEEESGASVAGAAGYTNMNMNMNSNTNGNNTSSTATALASPTPVIPTTATAAMAGAPSRVATATRNGHSATNHSDTGNPWSSAPNNSATKANTIHANTIATSLNAMPWSPAASGVGVPLHTSTSGGRGNAGVGAGSSIDGGNNDVAGGVDIDIEDSPEAVLLRVFTNDGSALLPLLHRGLVSALRLAMHVDPTAEVFAAAAQVHMLVHGPCEQALSRPWITHALRLNPAQPLALALSALTHLHDGNLARAQSACAALLLALNRSSRYRFLQSVSGEGSSINTGNSNTSSSGGGSGGVPVHAHAHMHLHTFTSLLHAHILWRRGHFARAHAVYAHMTRTHGMLPPATHIHSNTNTSANATSAYSSASTSTTGGGGVCASVYMLEEMMVDTQALEPLPRPLSPVSIENDGNTADRRRGSLSSTSTMTTSTASGANGGRTGGSGGAAVDSSMDALDALSDVFTETTTHTNTSSSSNPTSTSNSTSRANAASAPVAVSRAGRPRSMFTSVTHLLAAHNNSNNHDYSNTNLGSNSGSKVSCPSRVGAYWKLLQAPQLSSTDALWRPDGYTHASLAVGALPVALTRAAHAQLALFWRGYAWAGMGLAQLHEGNAHNALAALDTALATAPTPVQAPSKGHTGYSGYSSGNGCGSRGGDASSTATSPSTSTSTSTSVSSTHRRHRTRTRTSALPSSISSSSLSSASAESLADPALPILYDMSVGLRAWLLCARGEAHARLGLLADALKCYDEGVRLAIKEIGKEKLQYTGERNDSNATSRRDRDRDRERERERAGAAKERAQVDRASEYVGTRGGPLATATGLASAVYMHRRTRRNNTKGTYTGYSDVDIGSAMAGSAGTGIGVGYNSTSGSASTAAMQYMQAAQYTQYATTVPIYSTAALGHLSAPACLFPSSLLCLSALSPNLPYTLSQITATSPLNLLTQALAPALAYTQPLRALSAASSTSATSPGTNPAFPAHPAHVLTMPVYNPGPSMLSLPSSTSACARLSSPSSTSLRALPHIAWVLSLQLPVQLPLTQPTPAPSSLPSLLPSPPPQTSPSPSCSYAGSPHSQLNTHINTHMSINSAPIPAPPSLLSLSTSSVLALPSPGLSSLSLPLTPSSSTAVLSSPSWFALAPSPSSPLILPSTPSLVTHALASIPSDDALFTATSDRVIGVSGLCSSAIAALHNTLGILTYLIHTLKQQQHSSRGPARSQLLSNTRAPPPAPAVPLLSSLTSVLSQTSLPHEHQYALACFLSARHPSNAVLLLVLCRHTTQAVATIHNTAFSSRASLPSPSPSPTPTPAIPLNGATTSTSANIGDAAPTLTSTHNTHSTSTSTSTSTPASHLAHELASHAGLLTASRLRMGSHLHMLYGVCAEALGHPHIAITHFERALDIVERHVGLFTHSNIPTRTPAYKDRREPVQGGLSGRRSSISDHSGDNGLGLGGNDMSNVNSLAHALSPSHSRARHAWQIYAACLTCAANARAQAGHYTRAIELYDRAAQVLVQRCGVEELVRRTMEEGMGTSVLRTDVGQVSRERAAKENGGLTAMGGSAHVGDGGSGDVGRVPTARSSLYDALDMASLHTSTSASTSASVSSDMSATRKLLFLDPLADLTSPSLANTTSTSTTTGPTPHSSLPPFDAYIDTSSTAQTLLPPLNTTVDPSDNLTHVNLTDTSPQSLTTLRYALRSRPLTSSSVPQDYCLWLVAVLVTNRAVCAHHLGHAQAAARGITAGRRIWPGVCSAATECHALLAAGDVCAAVDQALQALTHAHRVGGGGGSGGEYGYGLPSTFSSSSSRAPLPPSTMQQHAPTAPTTMKPNSAPASTLPATLLSSQSSSDLADSQQRQRQQLSAVLRRCMRIRDLALMACSDALLGATVAVNASNIMFKWHICVDVDGGEVTHTHVQPHTHASISTYTPTHKHLLYSLDSGTRTHTPFSLPVAAVRTPIERWLPLICAQGPVAAAIEEHTRRSTAAIARSLTSLHLSLASLLHLHSLAFLRSPLTPSAPTNTLPAALLRGICMPAPAGFDAMRIVSLGSAEHLTLHFLCAAMERYLVQLRHAVVYGYPDTRTQTQLHGNVNTKANIHTGGDSSSADNNGGVPSRSTCASTATTALLPSPLRFPPSTCLCAQSPCTCPVICSHPRLHNVHLGSLTNSLQRMLAHLARARICHLARDFPGALAALAPVVMQGRVSMRACVCARGLVAALEEVIGQWAADLGMFLMFNACHRAQMASMGNSVDHGTYNNSSTSNNNTNNSTSTLTASSPEADPTLSTSSGSLSLSSLLVHTTTYLTAATHILQGRPLSVALHDTYRARACAPGAVNTYNSISADDDGLGGDDNSPPALPSFHAHAQPPTQMQARAEAAENLIDVATAADQGLSSAWASQMFAPQVSAAVERVASDVMVAGQDERDAYLLTRAAQLCLWCGDWTQAADLLRLAVLLWPLNVHGWLLRGAVCGANYRYLDMSAHMEYAMRVAQWNQQQHTAAQRREREQRSLQRYSRPQATQSDTKVRSSLPAYFSQEVDTVSSTSAAGATFSSPMLTASTGIDLLRPCAPPLSCGAKAPASLEAVASVVCVPALPPPPSLHAQSIKVASIVRRIAQALRSDPDALGYSPPPSIAASLSRGRAAAPAASDVNALSRLQTELAMESHDLLVARLSMVHDEFDAEAESVSADIAANITATATGSSVAARVGARADGSVDVASTTTVEDSTLCTPTAEIRLHGKHASAPLPLPAHAEMAAELQRDIDETLAHTGKSIDMDAGASTGTSATVKVKAGCAADNSAEISGGDGNSASADASGGRSDSSNQYTATGAVDSRTKVNGSLSLLGETTLSPYEQFLANLRNRR